MAPQNAFRKYAYYLYSVLELLSGFRQPLLIIGIFLNLAGRGVKTVQLRSRNLAFKVRGAMDVWSLKETFLDRFYEKYGFVAGASWTVIDIGAGTGDFSLFVAAGQPGRRVFAFEPFPESFDLLLDNLHLNEIATVQAFHEAIGAETGQLTLDLSSGEPLQFQSRHVAAESLPNSLTVRSVSLAEALARLDVRICDLLKLDCEGAEYPILFNAPPETLQRVERIVMEYHDQGTPYTHEDLATFLREHGYQVETFPNPVHAELGYLRAARTRAT